MKRFLLVASICLAFASRAQAELIDNHDGTITQVRSDGSRLMWMQDANYAKTSGFDADGMISWVAAVNWSGSMNFAGHTGWRLPRASENTAGSGGYSSQSEMGDLYYNELGNTAGNFENTGPFINIMDYWYWTNTLFEDPATAMVFSFRDIAGSEVNEAGYQSNGDISDANGTFAWLVRDLDPPRKADVTVWRPGTGIWYTLPDGDSGSYTTTQWGAEGDKPVPGDYDGDGKSDAAVWRPGNATWYIRRSSAPGTYTATRWGMPGDIAVPGDYDDDGKADLAMWRPDSGVWYIRPSGSPNSYTAANWGVPTDVPVPGDYDGDGRTDLAVYRPGTGVWYIRKSSVPGAYTGTAWGVASDIPVPGDYDADGRTDIAVWRPATGVWYVRPSNSTGYTATSWGKIGDTPVSGDYDGDGRADIAVWRSGSGVWYVRPSGSPGSYTARQWGIAGDKPVASQDFTGVPVQPPVAQSTSIDVNVLGIAASAETGAVPAAGGHNLPLTYAVETPPAYGSASVDPGTGAFTYSIAGHAQAAVDSFRVAVSNASAQSTAQIAVQLRSDPLLQNQWHLRNTGQDAFASTLPVPGNDMNMAAAWSAGYSGKGIKVGVVDTGLEAAHEDLAANVDVANSFNFVTGLNDPSPDAGEPGFDHGTSVAGIIGAAAFNRKGGRGVAYNARLRGYNLLSSFTVANMAKSLGSDPVSADNDVFNASFGNAAPSLPTFSGVYQSITANTLALREGRGAAIVNAAGNDFEDWGSYPDSGLCAAANAYGVSCGDTATDERRGGYAPIIVGAIDADGRHSSYSNTGASLWISAPAGEYGLDSAYFPGLVPDAYAPAIVTTSRTGCANARYSLAANPLDALGDSPFAADCQYTATMNGTSAATPNVTGVVAMMLEANPDLTVRDLKHILAKTARKTDASFAGVTATDIIPGSAVVLEHGWVTNSAGWPFSNRYGFGAVDASAAVAMAKTYADYLPPVQSSSDEFLVAPPAIVAPLSPAGSRATIQVAETFNTVESVIVFLNIAATPGLPCNQVELTSPSGTKSILMHAANGFANSSVVNSRILSNAFYGEPVNGNWVLTFYDFCDVDGYPTQLSTTNPQVLMIVGH